MKGEIALYVFITLAGLLIAVIILSCDRKGDPVKVWHKLLYFSFVMAWILFLFWIIWVSYSIGMVR